jgi:hypothetical protein
MVTQLSENKANDLKGHKRYIKNSIPRPYKICHNWGFGQNYTVWQPCLLRLRRRQFDGWQSENFARKKAKILAGKKFEVWPKGSGILFLVQKAMSAR